jgi:hypothetical protein
VLDGRDLDSQGIFVLPGTSGRWVADGLLPQNMGNCRAEIPKLNLMSMISVRFAIFFAIKILNLFPKNVKSTMRRGIEMCISREDKNRQQKE